MHVLRHIHMPFEVTDGYSWVQTLMSLPTCECVETYLTSQLEVFHGSSISSYVQQLPQPCANPQGMGEGAVSSQQGHCPHQFVFQLPVMASTGCRSSNFCESLSPLHSCYFATVDDRCLCPIAHEAYCYLLDPDTRLALGLHIALVNSCMPLHMDQLSSCLQPSRYCYCAARQSQEGRILAHCISMVLWQACGQNFTLQVVRLSKDLQA